MICDRHPDVRLERGIPCPACEADPPPASTVETSESIDRELDLLGQEMRTEAKFLRRHARELIQDGTAQDRRDAYKAYAEAFKAERIYIEIRDKAATRKQVREGLAELHAMQGKRA